MLKKIALILRNSGNPEGVKRADALAEGKSEKISLNLRSLKLKLVEVKAIAEIIKKQSDIHIHTISFSYNTFVGDEGAICIVNSLPTSIVEVGLVDCAIGDKGGVEILNWMYTANQLQMICMEQNNFSKALKKKFLTFRNKNPHIIVVI